MLLVKGFTLDEVHELRRVDVGRQKQASGFNSIANNSHTRALELLIVMIKDLGYTGFWLDAVGRSLSIESGDPTLLLLPRRLLPAHAALKENKKAKQKAEPLSHCNTNTTDM